MEPMHTLVRDFSVIHEAETPDCRLITLHAKNGVTVVCRIPHRTPTEETALRAEICEALARFAAPSESTSTAGRIRVLF